MTAFGAALALARSLHLAAILSVFGALMVTLVVEPAARAAPAVQKRIGARMRRLLQASALVAAVTALAWAALQAADMAGAEDLAEGLAALPVAVTGTRYGMALLVRLALLAVVAGTVARGHRRRAAGWLALLAGVALVTQSWMGHPAATEDVWLLLASMLHVLAAGAWLGGLAPLFIVVVTVGGVGAGRAAARFSWIGTVAVAVLAVTATIQGLKLIGDEGGWLGTSYGWLAIAKAALFAALLCLAAINRFRLTPALERGEAGPAAAAGRHLLASILAEAGLGLLVVLAAAGMATLPPGAHEQPLWPFALRPNMALLDDADVRAAFIEAGVLAAGAIALAVRGILLRRGRLLAILVSVAVLWYANSVVDAAPFLDPVLIEAHPTSYYRSTSGFTAASIADGARLFAANCAVCHGAEGRGDGPAAAALPVKPADLTAEHVGGHPDGEMFWWLTAGIPTRKGEALMPAFGELLSEDERWALIDYVHAHLAGAAMARSGQWPQPITPPATQASCGDGHMVDLEELHGRFVRIVAVPAGPVPAGDDTSATILIARSPVEASGCVAVGEDIWAAYAIIAGVAPEQLAGTEFLVDPNGWLRARVLGAQAPSWSQPGVLAALTQEIAAHPILAVAGGHHHH